MSYLAERQNEIKAFEESATDTSKSYYIEAFCFTYDYGLNIYFDDIGDLKKITKDVEYEFWLLGDHSREIEVDNFEALKSMIEAIESMDYNELDLLETYLQLIEGNFVSDLESAKEFYADNYICEFEGNDDFGRYLADDVGRINIPEGLEMYFDYEHYGRDMLSSDYCVHGGKVYYNHC